MDHHHRHHARTQLRSGPRHAAAEWTGLREAVRVSPWPVGQRDWTGSAGGPGRAGQTSETSYSHCTLAGEHTYIGEHRKEKRNEIMYKQKKMPIGEEMAEL